MDVNARVCLTMILPCCNFCHQRFASVRTCREAIAADALIQQKMIMCSSVHLSSALIAKKTLFQAVSPCWSWLPMCNHE